MTTAKDEAGSSGSHKDAVWVSTSYFAEGFPYMVVNELAVPLFKHLGAGLGAIGLTSLFHLPWNLKFLWGPAVDRYETKRRWTLAIELLLVFAMIAFALFADRPGLLGPISALFMVLAVLSSTHDIAVDGFYLEALDEAGQSRYVGLRVMAYRLAMLSIAGPGLILIARFGWTASLLAMSGIMAVLFVVHLRLLPRREARQEPISGLLRRLAGSRVVIAGAVLACLVVAARSVFGPIGDLGRIVRAARVVEWINVLLLVALAALVLLARPIGRRLAESPSRFARAYQSFIDQPRIGLVLAFIITFRVGESLLVKMKLPFLMDEVGLSLESYGLANGTVGLIGSISASILGGWLIARHGLRKWIWPFVLAQNVLNLLYVALASVTGWGIDVYAATAVITLERIGEGLGTAVLMVYTMRCCSPAHKAAHMAIATALMSVGYTLAGAYSGFLVEAVGFRSFFLVSFFATVPAMIIVPWLPHLDGRETSAS